MADSKTNVQIYPAKQRIVPNDRISKKLFNLTLDDLQDWIAQHKSIDFLEIQRHKKFGEIISHIQLSVDDETFTISESLDQFHCAVLCAGISELYFGNHQTLSAQIKNNLVLMYNNSLLDVPNMNNSRMNIGAKHYGMRRVQESSLHRQMSPTIKLADYFNKLRIENAHAQVKKDAREVLVTFFEHLQAKGVIKSFELTKKGNAFDALHFTPCKTAKKVKFKR